MKKSRIRVTKKKRQKLIFNLLLCVAVVSCLGYVIHRYSLIDLVFSVKNEIAGVEDEGLTERGGIYDRHYAPLAVDRVKLGVYCRSSEVENPVELIKNVSTVLPLHKEKTLAQIHSGELRVWLAENIDKEQEEQLKAMDIEGLYFDRKTERYYPQGALSAHLVGVMADDLGLFGAEHYFDQLLVGDADLLLTPVHGTQHLVLSLELKIQRAVDGLLQRLAAEGNVSQVAAYVMNASNGELLAGVHWPSFDANDYGSYDRSLQNNLFFKQIPFPHELEGVLKTSSSLFTQSEGGNDLPWAVTAPVSSMGGELRLWQNLGLDELIRPDFASFSLADERSSEVSYSSTTPSGSSLPRRTTPIQLLASLASLAHGTDIVVPHLARHLYNREAAIKTSFQRDVQGLEGAFMSGRKRVQTFLNATGQDVGMGNYYLNFSQNLQRSGLYHGPIGQDLIFCFAPTPQGDLAMLLVVERNSNVQNNTDLEIASELETLLKRTASLQQISAMMEKDHLQKEQPQIEYVLAAPHLQGGGREDRRQTIAKGSMPDLGGLSLRKSLVLLQGYTCEIQVEGTGWVSSQYPPAGASLQGVDTCRISLQSNEKMRPESWAKSAYGQQG